MLKVSHSSLQCFKFCPLKYKLSRIDLIDSAESSMAIKWGNAWHRAQEQWWASAGLEATLGVWDLEAAASGLTQDQIITGRVLLIAYDSLYTPDAGDVSIEQAFEVPIVGPDGEPCQDMLLRGAIDIRTPSMIMDHKTRGGKITPTYIKELNQEPQAEIYLLAARDLGHEPEYAIWDVVRRPSIRRGLKTPEADCEFYVRDGKYGKKGDPKPGTRLQDETWQEFGQRVADMVADSPDEYLRRVRLYKTEEDLDARRYDIWAQARLMQSAIEHRAFPRNEQSCSKFGGCEYIPVCWQGVDPAQSELYTIRKDEA